MFCEYVAFVGIGAGDPSDHTHVWWHTTGAVLGQAGQSVYGDEGVWAGLSLTGRAGREHCVPVHERTWQPANRQRVVIYTDHLVCGFSLRMPAPVFFLSLEFCNFWICCTLWDKTKGNVKRNWLSGRFFLLETNL